MNLVSPHTPQTTLPRFEIQKRQVPQVAQGGKSGLTGVTFPRGSINTSSTAPTHSTRSSAIGLRELDAIEVLAVVSVGRGCVSERVHKRPNDLLPKLSEPVDRVLAVVSVCAWDFSARLFSSRNVARYFILLLHPSGSSG